MELTTDTDTRQSGFTMIELMIALLMSTVMAMIVITLQPQTVKLQEEIFAKWQAQLAAESVADLLGSMHEEGFKNLIYDGAGTAAIATANATICTCAGVCVIPCTVGFDSDDGASAPAWLTTWLSNGPFKRIRVKISFVNMASSANAFVPDALPVRTALDFSEKDIRIVTTVTYRKKSKPNPAAAAVADTEDLTWTKYIAKH